MRVGRPLNGFPGAAVAAPGSLEVSQARVEQPGIAGGVPARGRGGTVWALRHRNHSMIPSGIHDFQQETSSALGQFHP